MKKSSNIHIFTIALASTVVLCKTDFAFAHESQLHSDLYTTSRSDGKETLRPDSKITSKISEAKKAAIPEIEQKNGEGAFNALVRGRGQQVQEMTVVTEEFSEEAAAHLNAESNTGSPESVSAEASSLTGLLERFLGFVRTKSGGKGLIVPTGIPLPRPPPPLPRPAPTPPRKCPPCPEPDPPVVHTGHKHYPCEGSHEHYFEMHQAPPPSCQCRQVKRTRCL